MTERGPDPAGSPVRDTRFRALFPDLARLPEPLAGELARQALPVSIPAGQTLFDPGQVCQALPLVMSGTIRVVKRTGAGREIRLYEVTPGEICIMTLGCLLGAGDYAATGLAETDVHALAVPRPLFLRLLENHAPFRARMFQLFSERLADLMQLVEEVAFRKLDRRLAGWLAARAPLVARSHQAMADDLGSVREIVSRLLRQFEEQGWVRLGRERVEVLDARALEDYSLAD